MSAVLATTGLSVRFGGVRAVDAVDVAVEEGQLVELIGPNGAGKTTFVDAITGFVRSTGRAELDGRDLAGLPPHARAQRGLARTWQSTELFDDLTVRENLMVAAQRPSFLALAAELVGKRVGESAAAEQALEFLDLGPLAESTPTELTQGQRKLVGVARAIAMEPRLLCLTSPRQASMNESEDLGLLADRERGHDDAADRPRHGTRGHLRPDHRAARRDRSRPSDEVRRDPSVVKATGRRRDPGRRSHRRHDQAGGPGSCEHALLELDGLTAGYDNAAVIRDISLAVARREIVALLGRTAGKTTTLRAVSGLNHPIRFEGGICSACSRAKAQSSASRTSREPRPVFGLTTFRLGYRGERLDADVAYRYFPALTELRDRRCGLLSGGEQQMLAVGRALARHPKLLLLDELSLGLAPVIVEGLLPVVREFAEESGCGVVLVEQHIALALTIADRGLVLAHGETALEGEAEHLRTNHDLLISSYFGEHTNLFAGKES
jgi:ABC-type branched-subunit amino acid transport system ATPase component